MYFRIWCKESKKMYYNDSDYFKKLTVKPLEYCFMPCLDKENNIYENDIIAYPCMSNSDRTIVSIIEIHYGCVWLKNDNFDRLLSDDFSYYDLSDVDVIGNIFESDVKKIIPWYKYRSKIN